MMKRFIVPRVAHCEEGCRIWGRGFISPYPFLLLVKTDQVKLILGRVMIIGI